MWVTFAWMAALLAIPLAAQESEAALTNPFTSDADVAGGEKIFVSQCASCHGRDGRGGGGGPDLTTGRFKRASSDEGIFQIINKGIPGTTMPGFQLNAGPVWRVVAYGARAGIVCHAQMRGMP
jgi:mono/diheme cytochrome c family protein